MFWQKIFFLFSNDLFYPFPVFLFLLYFILFIFLYFILFILTLSLFLPISSSLTPISYFIFILNFLQAIGHYFISFYFLLLFIYKPSWAFSGGFITSGHWALLICLFKPSLGHFITQSISFSHMEEKEVYKPCTVECSISASWVHVITLTGCESSQFSLLTTSGVSGV